MKICVNFLLIMIKEYKFILLGINFDVIFIDVFKLILLYNLVLKWM